MDVVLINRPIACGSSLTVPDGHTAGLMERDRAPMVPASKNKETGPRWSTDLNPWVSRVAFVAAATASHWCLDCPATSSLTP